MVGEQVDARSRRARSGHDLGAAVAVEVGDRGRVPLLSTLAALRPALENRAASSVAVQRPVLLFREDLVQSLTVDVSEGGRRIDVVGFRARPAGEDSARAVVGDELSVPIRGEDLESWVGGGELPECGIRGAGEPRVRPAGLSRAVGVPGVQGSVRRRAHENLQRRVVVDVPDQRVVRRAAVIRAGRLERLHRETRLEIGVSRRTGCRKRALGARPLPGHVMPGRVLGRRTGRQSAGHCQRGGKQQQQPPKTGRRTSACVRSVQ